MPPADDPLARLHGRASFFDALKTFWRDHNPPKDFISNPKVGGKELGKLSSHSFLIFFTSPHFPLLYFTVIPLSNLHPVKKKKKDLYVLFEAVRGLGGLERIGEKRQFALIRDLLQLPPGNTNYSTAMRSNYDRFCAPCDLYLINALENTYRLTNMYSPNHSWLQARIDVPLPATPSSEALAATHINSPASERKEQQDFLKHPEPTQAAIRARMMVNNLENPERDHDLFHGNESHLVHVDIRNHIVRMWYRETQRRLNVLTALLDVPVRFHQLGCRVFSYLECTGIINFGAIPIITPVALRSAMYRERRPRVAVVGAGISGLIAARQLRSFGLSVVVYEGKEKAGGRICTEKGAFSTGVDMGAMLITGVLQNPVAVLANQTDSRMHFLDQSCPLFDIDGTWVSEGADVWAEREYNAILDATARYRRRQSASEKAVKMSLGQAFQVALEKRVKRRKARIQARIGEISRLNDASMKEKLDEKDEDEFLEILPSRGKLPLASRSRGIVSRSSHHGTASLSSASMLASTRSYARSGKRDNSSNSKDGEMIQMSRTSDNDSSTERHAFVKASPPKDEKLISRLLRWHIANLEYACASDISKVSLVHWDQDDPYGFQGEHVLLESGYEPLLQGLVTGLERNLKYGAEVVHIKDSGIGVEVGAKLKDGRIEMQSFDAVLVTVPLGVLKEKTIKFEPPLPREKQAAIERLGTGGMMKVAMEFKEQFWVPNDMFGALRESVQKRGEFYFFWNLVPCTGKPILIAVVAEPSVQAMEEKADKEIVQDAMSVLRRCYPKAPDPIVFAISRWSKDCFARGAYSNIPVGSSGQDYDVLAEAAGNVFFGGEHTCRMNPTTCASGIISGLREASRIIEKLDVIPAIAEIHAECLEGGIAKVEKEREHGQEEESPSFGDEEADVMSQTPVKRSRLCVEMLTPQTGSMSPTV